MYILNVDRESSHLELKLYQISRVDAKQNIITDLQQLRFNQDVYNMEKELHSSLTLSSFHVGEMKSPTPSMTTP